MARQFGFFNPHQAEVIMGADFGTHCASELLLDEERVDSQNRLIAAIAVHIHNGWGTYLRSKGVKNVKVWKISDFLNTKKVKRSAKSKRSNKHMKNMLGRMAGF